MSYNDLEKHVTWKEKKLLPNECESDKILESRSDRLNQKLQLHKEVTVAENSDDQHLTEKTE